MMLNVFESLVLLELTSYDRSLARRIHKKKSLEVYLTKESDYIRLIRESREKNISIPNKKEVNKAMGKSIDIFEKSKKLGIGMISYLDGHYPYHLKTLGYDAPLVIFLKGRFGRIHSRHIAINDSSINATEDKTAWIQNMKELIKQDFAFISSLNTAIERETQEICIKTNGRSTVVFPCGLDMLDQKGNELVIEEITKKGLLISEYPIGRKATKNSNMDLGRIIAALSYAVIVPDPKLNKSTSTYKNAQKLNLDIISLELKKSNTSDVEEINYIINKLQEIEVKDFFANPIPEEKDQPKAYFFSGIDSYSNNDLHRIHKINKRRIDILNGKLQNLEPALADLERFGSIMDSDEKIQMQRDFRKERNRLVSANKEINQYLANNK